MQKTATTKEIHSMPQPKKAFTDAEIKKMVKRYNKGETLSEIAEDHDCTASTIRNRLLENGVTMRPRGKRAAS